MSFEHTVYQKIKDKFGNVVSEVEVELIEYDVTIDGALEIKSWSLWSERMNDWRKQDLEQIKKDWPSDWESMNQEIWEKYPSVIEGIKENDGLNWAKDQRVSNE